MKALPIIASLALVSCGTNSSHGGARAAAQSAVKREFGSDAVITSATVNGAQRVAVVCGYVATTDAPMFPRAAFIWTTERLDVSRWDDPQYSVFDSRARKICGPDWVQPKRVPAVS